MQNCVELRKTEEIIHKLNMKQHEYSHARELLQRKGMIFFFFEDKYDSSQLTIHSLIQA